MKRILKFLLYLFIISAAFRGIIEAFKEDPVEQQKRDDSIAKQEAELQLKIDSIKQAAEINKRRVNSTSTKQIAFSVISESKVGLKYEKRGTLKVRISNSYMPTKSEIRSIADRAFTEALRRKYDEEFTVFIYVEGMNINQSAFAWVEYVDGRFSEDYLSNYADDYFEENATSTFNKPSKFGPINDINSLNGWWTYGDDLLKIDIDNKVIKWNDGPNMRLGYLDTRDNESYDVKAFFLMAYIGQGTTALRAIVTINETEDEIYLERMDGGVSNRYKKLRTL